jgi:hypothetical protein
MYEIVNFGYIPTLVMLGIQSPLLCCFAVVKTNMSVSIERGEGRYKQPHSNHSQSEFQRLRSEDFPDRTVTLTRKGRDWKRRVSFSMRTMASFVWTRNFNLTLIRCDEHVSR